MGAPGLFPYILLNPKGNFKHSLGITLGHSYPLKEAQKGEYDKAIVAFTKAIELDPNLLAPMKEQSSADALLPYSTYVQNTHVQNTH